MQGKLLFVFAIAGLVIASAKSYSVDLFQPSQLGGMQLTPGHYTVEVVDQKAVLRGGKVKCEAPVKVEDADRKFNTTSVRFDNADGKMRIQEIHIGGSKTKLVFTE
jgi:hypothetical protein